MSAAANHSDGSATPMRGAQLMRLAVVERQLIMQGLDLTSLARLASTCSRLRAEALHREAGKLIPEPPEGSPLRLACSIHAAHPAHASPLFRAHAPVTLCFVPDVETEAQFDALMDKAATFSRGTFLRSTHSRWWTDDRSLRLFSLPCMREVATVGRFCPTQWLRSSRVQTALLSLPQLTFLDMLAGSTLQLLPSGVSLASKLSTVCVTVWHKHAATVRALRALHLAPALTILEVNSVGSGPAESVLAELVCCLPPTLTSLTLQSLELTRDVSRPLLKALFSRTPLLQSLELTVWHFGPILRGLLDAGLRALPRLRRVRFYEVGPVVFRFGLGPDQIPALLRCFLHRFPQVSVQVDIAKGTWRDQPEQLSAMQLRYQGWPRVELRWAESGDRMEAPPSLHAPDGGASGRPPSPHASDDEDGSDVEEWTDPHPLQSEEDSNQS